MAILLRKRGQRGAVVVVLIGWLRIKTNTRHGIYNCSGGSPFLVRYAGILIS
ncbi:hypothetical protein LguiA_007808 [Lonicera macranthoides]